jgi:hypothetical protein
MSCVPLDTKLEPLKLSRLFVVFTFVIDGAHLYNPNESLLTISKLPLNFDLQ